MKKNSDRITCNQDLEDGNKCTITYSKDDKLAMAYKKCRACIADQLSQIPARPTGLSKYIETPRTQDQNAITYKDVQNIDGIIHTDPNNEYVSIDMIIEETGAI